MRKFTLLLCYFVLLGLTVRAQNPSGSITGTLVDSSGNKSLSSATVSLLLEKDSSLVTYLLTDSNGLFAIKDLGNEQYRVVISYQGFVPYEKTCIISEQVKYVNLGNIHMQIDPNIMDEVVLISNVPIQIKGDTTQFNASAFKTVPNANAEDLFKKLPGVEVDMDGNVRAQGEEVTKIFVDGKEFFGKDPKMATKNITAEMIQSVQVYDDMSDQAKFTRIDDGSRTKTINIVLKKNRRKGYFGKGVAGMGNDNRFQSSLNSSHFDEERRISLVGSSNNINKQGFGGGRAAANTPANTRGNIAGIGITTATAIGLNYTNKIGKKVDITGSYNYSETNNRRQQTNYRESTFFNDSSAAESSRSNSSNISRNHRANIRLEYYIDSLNSLLFTPNITLEQSDNSSISNSSTQASTPSLKYMSNSNNSNRNAETNSMTMANELLYRRKFKKTGRSFTLGYSNVIDNSDGSGTNISPITFFNANGSVLSVIDQNFENAQMAKSKSNIITSSFTEMFGKHKILELNYAYTNKHSSSDKDAFNYNSTSKEFDIINKQQTNYFENDFMAHRYGGNFRYLQTKYSIQAGTSVQSSVLNNQSIRGIYQINGKDSVIYTKQRATNLFPTANFTYNFSKKTNLNIRYRGRTNQPNVAQLQDVPDLTNLLRIRVGNPLLKQEFGHNLDLSFKTLNTKSNQYLNVSVNGSQTSNRIVSSTDSLSLFTMQGLGLADSLKRPGVQLIKPINLNGAYNISYNITMGFPFKKWKGSSVNFSNVFNCNRSLSMLYKKLNVTNGFTLSQSAGINLDVKEKFNVGLKAKVAYSQARYSISQGKNNSEYFTQSYSTDLAYYLRKTLILSTDFDYLRYTGQSAGFNQNVPLWNANIAKQFFKKKNGELKFSVNDILNQNQSITRIQGENYYSDSRTVVLQRYYMLSFTYNLNRFGGKGAKQPVRNNDNRMNGRNNGNGRNNQMDNF